MSTCDVCGKELTPKVDTVRLYAGKVIKRAVSENKVMGPGQLSTAFENLQPVEITVCSRHRWELFKQRIVPGVICFVILFFPLLFIVGNLLKLVDAPLPVQYYLTFPIDLLVSALLTRLISYEALLAAGMNLRERRKGTGIEYVTEGKYRRMLNQKQVGRNNKKKKK